MKKFGKRMASLLLAAIVFLTSSATPVQAAGEQEPPTEVTYCEKGGFMPETLNLGFDDTTWMDKIDGVRVNGITYDKGSTDFGASGQKWEVGSATGAYGSYKALKIISSDSLYPATIQISAEGYKDLTLEVVKNSSYAYTATIVDSGSPEETTYTATAATSEHGTVTLSATEGIKAGDTVTATITPETNYELDTLTVTGASGTAINVTNENGSYTFQMPAENVTVSASFKEKKPTSSTKIEVSQIKLSQDYFGHDWQLSFPTADGYVAAITGVKVNGTDWKASIYEPSSGGSYYKNTDSNQLIFSAKDFSSNPSIPALKSGDSVVITAAGYEDLAFKLVIDINGNASLVEDDGQGDPYELHVKIDGSFEAAIVGQKDYDGVSSASTGGSSSNKNSNVTVYGALVEKGTVPEDTDWEELDNTSQIALNGSKCKVNIVPDTANGTSNSSDSGMEGVYMTISSALTLRGTPKDPGSYLISIYIEDDQGRQATSNTLPFRIYTGEETLADQLKTENLKQYDSGLYAWDIMEPWAISAFGSNVDGETESVRVPKDLEAWFGSHTSGTYGYLGYDLPWEQVVSGDIPQTLYIPDGCNLTLTNMEILSSVRIVVENGGKLTLDDSVVQGIIDIQSGGTFSMNYDAYNQKFTTGASVSGQIRLADGATLENAAIYSHINYLANGDRTDRTSSEPVVTATGNVTIKGQVFIEGDEGGRDIGQTALRVTDGTLTLEKGAVLAAYGGGGKVVNLKGGTAIELQNGHIEGDGKVIAMGGPVLWMDGGTAISGTGSISTTSVFLQGATSSEAWDATPGKAIVGNIEITSANRHVEDGTQIPTAADDPLAYLYWNPSTGPTPSPDNYPASEHTHVEDTSKWVANSDVHWHPCTGNGCAYHFEQSAHSFIWVVDKASTTEATGLRHEQCTVCGYKRNMNSVIDKLPTGNSGNTNQNNSGNSGSGSSSSSSSGSSGASLKTASANVASPRTGDSSPVILWMTLAAASVAAAAGRVLFVRKRRRNEN